MARLPRFDFPSIPQHVVQRGNNRLPCFLDDGDRLRYLQQLREASSASNCQVHAYVLMDNHVHLLVTPGEIGSIGRMMQRLGRSYVSLFNARHGRTGTLWEGRYKACLVDSEEYVLRCHRYIELNPVRARLTDDPATYRWSSCSAYLGQRPASNLSEHAAWQALGTTRVERQAAWRQVLDEALPPHQLRGNSRLPATATGTGTRRVQIHDRGEDTPVRIGSSGASTASNDANQRRMSR